MRLDSEQKKRQGKIEERRIPEKVRATTDVIGDEFFTILLLTKFLQWISPEKVTHEATIGGFGETVDLTKVVQVVKIRG